MSRLTWRNRPLYENAARIVVTNNSCSTILRIITRHSNGKHSFYLNRQRFIEWLDNRSNQYLEMDGSYLLRAMEYHGIVSLHFYWMCECHGGQLQGLAQNVDIPLDELRQLMLAKHKGAFFTYQGKYEGRVQFDFSHAARTLHGVCADLPKRRALSKALRNRISSRYGEVIYAYNDFPDCFYLIHSMSGNHEHNGGLILHHGKRDGRQYLSYDFHT